MSADDVEARRVQRLCGAGEDGCAATDGLVQDEVRVGAILAELESGAERRTAKKGESGVGWEPSCLLVGAALFHESAIGEEAEALVDDGTSSESPTVFAELSSVGPSVSLLGEGDEGTEDGFGAFVSVYHWGRL